MSAEEDQTHALNDHHDYSLNDNINDSPVIIDDLSLTNGVENDDGCTLNAQIDSSAIDQTFNDLDISNDHQHIVTPAKISSNCDGNDSGVEIGTLQRAFSNNSGGYASSCCGGGGGGLDDVGGTASCNSSLISCCSDFCDGKLNRSKILRHNSTNDCTSEGGSESSSITGDATIRRSSMIKKKVAVTEPINSNKTTLKKDDNSVAKSRARAASANRTAAAAAAAATTVCLVNVRSNAPNLATRERAARSREKNPPSCSSLMPSVSSASSSSSSKHRSTSTKRLPKADSLPNSTKDPSSPAIIHRSGLCRAHSITRGRTPGGTPTIEDGRWPSLNGTTIGTNNCKSTVKQLLRTGSITPDGLVIKTKAGPLMLDFKSSNIDKYATLPRRRKEKSDDDFRSSSGHHRSSSVQRDRMITSLTKRQSFKEQTPSKAHSLLVKTKKNILKTKIYHETAIQTALTCQDIQDAFAGIVRNVCVESVEKYDQASQSDIRDKEIERLENTVKKLSADCACLQGTITERSQLFVNVEQQLGRERDEKEALHRELKSNTERVMAMLELVNCEPLKEDNCDSLLMLESQIQQSGYALEEKQSEIKKLHSFCNKLQLEMQRSISVQRILRQEREVFEKESTELQDFLQDEKSALMDALKETECEMEKQRDLLAQRDNEVEQLRNECRQLVRISEQRRQEYLGMQSKYNALESRSKELIVQQSTAVSGASMALAGLGSRLDHLVDQLISSFNISEQELEDVIFHNEAYTNSASGSEDASPVDDGDGGGGGGDDNVCDDSVIASINHIVAVKSPQRHQSFVTAVINAIRNAASTAKYSVVQRKDYGTACRGYGISNNGTGNNVTDPNGVNSMGADESDSTEMLDSETEPCLMMEHVLEDVAMPDSHSHNMVSSSGMILSQIELPSSAMMNRDEESFHNLSQAIANRHRIELHSNRMFRANSEHSTSEEASMHESVADIPSISDYCSAQAVVDQVIDVDNLVTKLLKVLRIIQMDNDNCIQQLVGEKNKLQLNKEEMLEKLKDWEELHVKLKRDLEDATHQLMVNSSDLANSRIDLQRHRAEIDRLNLDICNLSTLCSQKQMPTKETILNTIKMWKDSQTIPEPEILTHILSACHEIPVLREQLFVNQRNDVGNNSTGKMILLDNWHDTVSETKRQYDAIDRALETLSTIQSVVQQCPELATLQRDLEETNFQSAGILPIYSAFLTASTTGGINQSGSTSLTSSTNKSDCNANAASTNGAVQFLKNGTTNDSPTKNAVVDSTA